jgi:multimeric flavodoxin WrbA
MGETCVKILGVNGSPHRSGNTVKLISEIFRGAETNSHHCEIVHLVDLDLNYCNWCEECYPDGVCPIDDGFQEHLKKAFEADVLVVGTPSINRSVTGYMKNWLDRLCTSQLVYTVDENRKVTMQSRVPAGKKAIVVVQGCTNLLQETVEPINVVMNVLGIPIAERLIVPRVGLTHEDTVDKKRDVMQKAYEIGKNIQ